MARRKNLFLTESRWAPRRILRAAAYVVLLLVLCGGSWLAYFATRPISVAPGNRTFAIEPGRNLREVAVQFAKDDLVSDPWSFIVLARLTRTGSDLKAGSYSVGADISPYRLLKKIVRGEFAMASVQFIEGWTFLQMRAALDRHPAVRHELRDASMETILERLQISELSAEGLFFPDTYQFSAGTSDLTILRQANLKMRQLLAAQWEKRASALPLASPYEALILASIVEKEAGRRDEHGKVASVFINRLKRGMRLQTDPTVIYGLGAKFDGNLRRKDLTTDNKYNTYMRGGLPPTPIAMPGEASLAAVMNPAAGNALYFVARGDGSHQFSTNLSDHNRAVDKYQKSRK
ncbi:MAG: endolytic transglycosylase MltG [Burkholderiales bacterium]